MKKLSYVLILVLALTAMLISACGGSAAVSAPDSSSVGGGKPQASHVEFTGVIESIVGTEWIVSGQKITVDPALAPDGTFAVGDTVKVAVQVQADDSMVVSQVEAPASADDNSNDANDNDANSNDANDNDANSNDANGNDDNSNDANDNDANSNDANGNDANSNDANDNDANSNDDNSNDDNSNDDNSNDDNSNDDNSNDDNSNDDNENASNTNGG
jgi:hypothetical protein